jgi:hypothetical protein
MKLFYNIAKCGGGGGGQGGGGGVVSKANLACNLIIFVSKEPIQNSIHKTTHSRFKVKSRKENPCKQYLKNTHVKKLR